MDKYVNVPTSPPLALAIAHVGLTVSSLDKALAFWCGVLGCQLVVRKDLGSGPAIDNIVGVQDAAIEIAVVVLPDGGRIELLEYRSPHGGRVSELNSNDIGSSHLALRVQDLDATLLQVESAGWMRLGAPQSLPVGRVVYVRGPEGHTIEFMQPPAAIDPPRG
ncbi:VOC family protein [Paenarthrobacter sp. 2TAF44]|uniref:VOC family protein n=1 Tax=Paenarthrobacter sp. 2TAF44 TaxID=3233018 RepID=UPI003F960D18